MKKGQNRGKKKEHRLITQKGEAAAENIDQVVDRLQTLPENILNKIQEHEPKSSFKYISSSIYSIFNQNQTLDTFLQSVAFGKLDKVEQLFTEVYSRHPAKIQDALRYQGKFTDYSSRTFNCTAFEYAYWSKDVHMCRMLERYMNDETKAKILVRINTIEEEGLLYRQNGQSHQSSHFDLTPLKQAYWRYLDGFESWYAQRNMLALDLAWWDLGKAQRDLPAHIAQEYCQLNRSFQPTPNFNDALSPRNQSFLDLSTGSEQQWFPLAASDSGLGFNFAFSRGNRFDRCVAFSHGYSPGQRPISIDFIAIGRLDEVRTLELKLLREHFTSAVALSIKA